MYSKNEYVMHHSEGVCQVEDIRRECFPGVAPRQYYILRPVYENAATTVYVPVDGETTRLRPLVTEAEIRRFLTVAVSRKSLWKDNERERQDTFNNLLREGEPVTLLRLLLDIREHQHALAVSGRKLRFFDERILQEVERQIKQEYAHVLSIEPETVLPFITRHATMAEN